MKITPERLQQLLHYDPCSGVITKVQNNRMLTPDDAGCVVVHDSESGSSVKIKYDKLAYLLAYKKQLKANQRLLHKNLDTEDCRLHNMVVVSREVFLKVKEAKKNLDGGIKMLAHSTDQFSYVVHWYENHKPRKKLIRDVVLAQKFILRLKLKYSKVLTTYCVFD